MDRDTAVTRITDGLGFVTAHGPKAILRLQEAQRDLEKGKTLPTFLLNLTTSISVVAGTNEYALPTRFLRLAEQSDYPMHYYQNAGDEFPVYLQKGTQFEIYDEVTTNSERGPPTWFLLSEGSGVVNFFPTPDAAYTISVPYYRGGELLTSNVENSWLANAPEWLIGEAGLRLAADLRDAEAVALFQAMAQKGRAAAFGETLAAEQQFAPISMGMSL